MGLVAGRILLMPKGHYDENKLYQILDAVSYDNKLWIAKKSNLIGIQPSKENSDSWMFAADGTYDITELQESVVKLNAQILEKSDHSTVLNATLLNSDWNSLSNSSSGARYSLKASIPNLRQSSVVALTINGLTITQKQLIAYKKAKIESVGQENDGLTLYAYGEKPSIDLPITIIIWDEANIVSGGGTGGETGGETGGGTGGGTGGETGGGTSSNWSVVTGCPYDQNGSSIVVYNDAVYFLGGSVTSPTDQRKQRRVWDPSTNRLSGAPDIPYEFANGLAFVFNNKIHILGGNLATSDKVNYSTQGRNHYAFNGTSWESQSTLPSTFNGYDMTGAVLGDTFELIGRHDNTQCTQYTYTGNYVNGNLWTTVGGLTKYVNGAIALVYPVDGVDRLHLIGRVMVSNGNVLTKEYIHYYWTGSLWTHASDIPYEMDNYGTAVVYNGKIHIMGGSGTKNHYSYDGSSWTKEADLPEVINDHVGGRAFVYQDRLYVYINKKIYCLNE